VSGTVRGRLHVGDTDCSTATTDLKIFRLACSERVHCASELMMDSTGGNSLFDTKTCVCASIAFLAKIISWSVDIK
jgi:hypothetical protein